jgi:hypothetical protein
MILVTPAQSLTVVRATIDCAYLCDEAECLDALLSLTRLDEIQQAQSRTFRSRIKNSYSYE